MAVAAYASVLSLLRVLGNIQHPSQLRLFPDPKQIDALLEKLSFLQEFLEVHSSAINEDTEFILRKITRVTFDVEILINNYVVEQLYRELGNVHNDVAGFCDIDTIHDMMHLLIQEIAPSNEALARTIQYDQEQPPPIVLNNKDHSQTSSGERNKMVGFDDRLNHVLEKLTGNQPNLIIVPIVGMGGIGKTTLARSLFDHPFNRDRFHVRIWLTISQDYSVKKVLQGLLRDGVLGDNKTDTELGSDKSEAKLITQLYQKLIGQRYLIVLDDVWSVEAWYDLKRGFPDNGKRSRVMVTTRLYDIANSLDSSHNSNTYSMELLDEDKSWDLFCEVAFQRGVRSLKLQEIGRKISKRCGGLPLLLVVFGGLLANSEMTVEYWQTVAEDINSFASTVNDEHCLKILSLSYHHLPIHLKACFLYARHFKEDSWILVSELVESLVSEGLVKPMEGKTLEEAARKYLEDLIGRNMLLIHERGYDGSTEICGIHDVLRELSIKESNKEQFLELPKASSVKAFEISVVCAICKERKMATARLDPEILGFESDGIVLVCSCCENIFEEFPLSPFVMAAKINSQDVTLPTTCRWVHIYHSGHSVSNTLRLFWNLEFLQITASRVVALPEELWEMPQLRHVRAEKLELPDPADGVIIVLENLQTLKTVAQFKCTEEIVRRIPNLRDLDLLYDGFLAEEEEDWSSFCLRNLGGLQMLESLTITCHRMVSMDLKKGAIAFPCSLKELTLWNCGIAWDDLTIIDSSLRDLQALRLSHHSVVGEEWVPIEGEFPRLKYLRLWSLDLVHWRVDHEAHFPALETLVLDDMQALNLDGEIGELPSLKSIYLRSCNERLIDSARAIVEEQHSNGNEGLLLHVED